MDAMRDAPTCASQARAASSGRPTSEPKGGSSRLAREAAERAEQAAAKAEDTAEAARYAAEEATRKADEIDLAAREAAAAPQAAATPVIATNHASHDEPINRV